MVYSCRMALKQSPTASRLCFAVFTFLLALLFAWIPTIAAAPIQQANETNSTGIQWRLVTGVRTVLFYSANTREPPIVMTQNDDVTQIISALCDLLMQYELVSKVYGEGDLQVLLKQNLMEACRWIQTLNTDGIVELLFPEMATNCSCSPEDVTFLHRHCSRTKLLPTILDASFLIQNHLQDAVKNVNPYKWINTFIPESHRDSIKANL